MMQIAGSVADVEPTRGASAMERILELAHARLDVAAKAAPRVKRHATH